MNIKRKETMLLFGDATAAVRAVLCKLNGIPNFLGEMHNTAS